MEVRVERKVLWAGRCRIYFNAYEEGPRFWSVDNGSTETEVKCNNVHFRGTGFTTKVNAGSKIQPRAWIEVDDARIWLDDQEVTVDSTI